MTHTSNNMHRDSSVAPEQVTSLHHPLLFTKHDLHEDVYTTAPLYKSQSKTDSS